MVGLVRGWWTAFRDGPVRQARARLAVALIAHHLRESEAALRVLNHHRQQARHWQSEGERLSGSNAREGGAI